MKRHIRLFAALLYSCLICSAYSARIAFHFVTSDANSLSELKIEKQPFLTNADILTYTWTNHTMSVTSNAIARLPEIRQVGTGGKAFVVIVDGKRRYRGAFWSSGSSISHFHPVILVDHYDPACIAIFRMYPSLDSTEQMEFVGDGKKIPFPDSREDETLKRVLKELGTLKETKAPNK